MLELLGVLLLELLELLVPQPWQLEMRLVVWQPVAVRLPLRL